KKYANIISQPNVRCNSGSPWAAPRTSSPTPMDAGPRTTRCREGRHGWQVFLGGAVLGHYLPVYPTGQEDKYGDYTGQQTAQHDRFDYTQLIVFQRQNGFIKRLYDGFFVAKRNFG